MLPALTPRVAFCLKLTAWWWKIPVSLSYEHIFLQFLEINLHLGPFSLCSYIFIYALHYFLRKILRSGIAESKEIPSFYGFYSGAKLPSKKVVPNYISSGRVGEYLFPHTLTNTRYYCCYYYSIFTNFVMQYVRSRGGLSGSRCQPWQGAGSWGSHIYPLVA